MQNVYFSPDGACFKSDGFCIQSRRRVKTRTVANEFNPRSDCKNAIRQLQEVHEVRWHRADAYCEVSRDRSNSSLLHLPPDKEVADK